MRILLTGPTGQVGSALLQALSKDHDVLAFTRDKLDLSRPETIRAVAREAKPQVIVNAAAYTAVDQAEKEEALAMAVNRDGPAILAEEAARCGALLVHFSTDYVFDGEKAAPYAETDVPNPLNAYGRTKLAGERAIAAAACRHVIFRTSWVYAASGKNFLRTMLSLAGQGKRLRVVDDQFGAPTSNLMIARAVAEAMRRVAADASLTGTYHMTASGNTTWYGFARAIFEATGRAVELAPIPSSEYKTPARRPRNSILNNAKLAARLGIRLPSWEDGLRQVVHALR